MAYVGAGIGTAGFVSGTAGGAEGMVGRHTVTMLCWNSPGGGGLGGAEI